MKNIIFIISFFFISIGYSQDFWQQTNGPGGGTVNSLTQNSKGYIFAATDSGVYRSIDNGDNWTLLNNGLPPTRIKNIATNNDGHIFAGISSKGVFRSTDNGDTWVKINNGLPDTFINALTVNSNGDLFTTPSGGIYRSTDNGNNWVQVYSSLHPSGFYCSSKGDIIASGDWGTSSYPYGNLYRSTDKGDTWNLFSFGYITTLIPVAYNANGIIFVGVNPNLLSSSNTIANINRSEDDGVSWVKTNFNYSPRANINSISINTYGDVFIGTSSGGPGSSSGVYLTSDNGENWLPINSGLTDTNIYSLLIDKNGYILAGSKEKGVFRSVNSTVGITDKGNIIRFFMLEQNYPNPFNPNTIISYSLPSGSKVKLIVYNTLGQSIKILENSFKNAGNYSINFNASDLPSGIYFYKLEAGQFTQVKKMILLK
jgi:photosystem II stability/assembly factor-like uncharacterized protein